MKVDANDVAAALGPAGLQEAVERAKQEAIRESLQEIGWTSFRDLSSRHREYRPSVIKGLLREGETMNLIADPKVGKSWLCYWLAMSVINGGYWLQPEWHCERGDVVLVDNELHEETLAVRLATVHQASESPDSLKDHLHVCALRGKSVSIDQLAQYLSPVRHLRPKLIILDSLYRFLPEGTSENDNAAMMQVYNKLDRLARDIGGVALVAVHHASKGEQGGKKITDVGSGAGAQSRACDTHLTIRQHEEDSHFVIGGVCRTWKQPQPFVVEWEWPYWTISTKSPTNLKGRRASRADRPELGELDDAAFVSYLNGDWKNRASMVARICEREGCARRNAEHRVDEVIERHRLKKLKGKDEKDCGAFIARFHHSIQFRLKRGE